MLSWLVFLVNIELTVPANVEKFHYLSPKIAAPMDVELDDLPGPHGNVSLPTTNSCCSTDHVELADLPGQHEITVTVDYEKFATCLE